MMMIIIDVANIAPSGAGMGVGGWRGGGWGVGGGAGRGGTQDLLGAGR